jgi:hypothetical protein
VPAFRGLTASSDASVTALPPPATAIISMYQLQGAAADRTVRQLLQDASSALRSPRLDQRPASVRLAQGRPHADMRGDVVEQLRARASGKPVTTSSGLPCKVSSLGWMDSVTLGSLDGSFMTDDNVLQNDQGSRVECCQGGNVRSTWPFSDG